MLNKDPEPTDLVRALQAIGRSQARLLRDIREVCAGDPRFLDAFQPLARMVNASQAADHSRRGQTTALSHGAGRSQTLERLPTA